MMYSNEKCQIAFAFFEFSHLFEGGPLPRVEGVGVAVAGVILRN